MWSGRRKWKVEGGVAVEGKGETGIRETGVGNARPGEGEGVGQAQKLRSRRRRKRCLRR